MRTPNYFLKNKLFSNKKRVCHRVEVHEQKCGVHNDSVVTKLEPKSFGLGSNLGNNKLKTQYTIQLKFELLVEWIENWSNILNVESIKIKVDLLL